MKHKDSTIDSALSLALLLTLAVIASLWPGLSDSRHWDLPHILGYMFALWLLLILLLVRISRSKPRSSSGESDPDV